jgi:hypothetical protein
MMILNLTAPPSMETMSRIACFIGKGAEYLRSMAEDCSSYSSSLPIVTPKTNR